MKKKIIKVLVICVEISIGFTALGTILKKVTQLIISGFALRNKY